MVLNKVLSSQGLHKNNIVNKPSTCTTCALAKTYKLPFYSTHVNASMPFELLYFDIWRPPQLAYKYFLLIVDNCTKFSWIYFLHSRDQVVSIFLSQTNGRVSIQHKN